MVFNARAWLADQIGCDPAELTLAGSPAWSPDGTEQGEYRRGDAIVARVVVTGVHERFGEPPYRIVMTTSRAGLATLHLGPDEAVTW
jgi:hypothetical protein